MFVNIFLELGVFLVLLLAILLVIFFRHSNQENTQVPENIKPKPMSLAGLVEEIKSKITSKKDLEKKLAMVLKNYATIDDFSLYKELIQAVILSPYTNKNIILSLDKELSQRNPSYKKRISDSIVEGLNLR